LILSSAGSGSVIRRPRILSSTSARA
jgi:hypothetical protein